MADIYFNNNNIHDIHDIEINFPGSKNAQYHSKQIKNLVIVLVCFLSGMYHLSIKLLSSMNKIGSLGCTAQIGHT